VWSNGIVERQVSADAGAGLGDGRVGVEIHLSYFTERQRRSTNTLSRQQPLPSMLMAIFSRRRAAVNAVLVNCDP